MTFEQTMHTIESHLEALQADYDRLLEENNQLKAVIAEHKGTDSNSDNSKEA